MRRIPCAAPLLFISCHLLHWEQQGLAEVDNELGVETVRVRPWRRKCCNVECLIGHSGVMCRFVTAKIVCAGTVFLRLNLFIMRRKTVFFI